MVIRVLVVDDSAVFRGLWATLVNSQSDMKVVNTAGHGDAALLALQREAIDVVILDVEMPGMDGLEAIPLMLKIHPHLKIIMASGQTSRSSDATVQALTLGAVDFVTKPVAISPALGVKEVGASLLAKIRALTIESVPKKSETVAIAKVPMPAKSRPAPQLIVIGSSTGGPNALSEVFRRVPPEMRVPILVVQHMPASFIRLLAERFAKECGRPCHEAQAEQVIEPGSIYIAPGDVHMTVVRRDKILQIALDARGEPENFCRPAVDPLFRSAASVVGSSVLAVVLTGMGEDGRRGCEDIVQSGGCVLVQDEESSVVWGMPGAVATRGLAHWVLPLSKIGGQITSLCAASASEPLVQRTTI